MTRKRFVAATAVAFIVSQILTIAIHGFVLAADYAPFYGTLLRPMATEGSWRLLLLPFSHLCFVTVLVWLYGRTRLEGGRFSRGLKLGLIGFVISQLPHLVLWYAEQPWPGLLVAKQLALEFLSALVVGLTIAAVAGRTTAPAMARPAVTPSEPALRA